MKKVSVFFFIAATAMALSAAVSAAQEQRWGIMGAVIAGSICAFAGVLWSRDGRR